MAQKKSRDNTSREWQTAAEETKRQLDMLDERLDNIDSIVSAVVERVMNQPLVISITCPHCGKNVEVSVIGSKKPGK